MSVKPFRWKKSHLEVLDQRLLPAKYRKIICRRPSDVAKAIRDMAIRGAPAIGCVAAYGMVLAAKLNRRLQLSNFEKAGRLLKSARPTGVNLAWAVERMLGAAKNYLFSRPSVPPRRGGRVKVSLFDVLLAEAGRIEAEDLRMNRAIGRMGAKLFRKRKNVVLTHCNAGALATAGHGTALGVIRELHREKKIKKVFVDETRPYLQGARLTAWELAKERIPHELITDNMAAHFMKTEKVDGVIVGCDRVAANGDTANKIGTYNVAILAKYHRIPFYVAMPTSTLDLKTKSGRDIRIEDRSSDEVIYINGNRIAPRETKARHPAFDVTPARLISGFVTERGIVRAPYKTSLKKLISKHGLLQNRQPVAN